MEQKENTKGETRTLNKAVGAGKWMTIDYVAQKILSMSSFVVLARLLAPADFGIVTLMLLAPTFLNSITEPNFNVALTQKSEPIEKYLNPIWTISFLKPVIISLIVFFGAPIIANFLHIERAVTAIRISGIFVIIYNLENIGFVYLFKNLELKGVFLRNILKEIAYIAVALPWALLAPSYWALVAGSLASYIVYTASTYFIHPYRPKISFNFKVLLDLVGYTKWVYFQTILTQIYGNIENVVIGRSIGASAVGLYSRAKSLSGMIPGFLTSIMRVVAFPTFAKIKDSSEKVERGFRKSMRLLFFLYIPIIVVLWLWAEKLILSVLGEQWVPMAGALKILVIASSLNSITNTAFSLFQGIGRPDIEPKANLIQIPLLTLSVLILAPYYGIIGVSLAFLASSLPPLAFSFYKIRKIVKLGFFSIFKSMIIPFLASCLAIFPTLLIKDFLSEMKSLAFFISMVAVGFIYLAIIVLTGVIFKRGPYNTLKIIFKNAL